MDAAVSQTIDEILAGFVLPNAAVEPLADSFHTNLQVRSGNETFFLKIVNDEYDERRIRSQIEFMDHLRCGGLPVVETVPAGDGKPYVKSADGKSIGILSRWIDGRNMDQQLEDEWPARCGELLARVHQRSTEFQPSAEFAVRVWDATYAPQPRSWLDRFLEQAAFDDASCRVIRTSANRIGSMVHPLGDCEASYGVIHADFHADNLIFDGTNVWILDFEDVGWGHYLFDLTWPEAMFAKDNGSSRYFESFRNGYERMRPLSELERAALPQFRLAAGIAVLEMIDTSPIANENPKAREWFCFAVDWLRSHLEAVHD